jgi:hypothetical protein
VSPDRNLLLSALRQQQRTAAREVDAVASQVSIACSFYIVPNRSFDYANLTQVSAPSIFINSSSDGTVGLATPHFLGTLTLASDAFAEGSFKTAHIGTVVFEKGDNELTADSPTSMFANRRVCVKQAFYVDSGTQKKKRYFNKYALEIMRQECDCLDWATALLNLTYDFVSRQQVNLPGDMPFAIPEIRFVRAMLGYGSLPSDGLSRAFLIEEWIESDNRATEGFLKYISNGKSATCLGDNAPHSAYEIAEFLSFAQHVQWKKSGFIMFTADYQGQSAWAHTL